MFGIALALSVVGFTLAQDPAKTAKGKDSPADAKSKTDPALDQIVNNMLQRMDTNKDGKISKSEAQGPLAANFDRYDTNKDGFLDRTELLAVARQVQAMRQAGGPGMGGFGPGAMRPDPLDFDALDKNADGRLTREELKGTRFYDLFDAIDTNKDGKIDPKEWAAYHAKNREKKD
jgi:Ca2+-binding EF-hand superfamily protein